MAPTRIYVKPLLPLIHSGRIGALAHITGGGLLENIPRVLPEGLHALVDADSWEQPRLMAFLQAQGNIEPEEMARTIRSEKRREGKESVMTGRYRGTRYNIKKKKK